MPRRCELGAAAHHQAELGLAAPDPRIKAAVVMAPAGILFDAKGLSGVRVPLKIYRAADDSHVRNEWNADHVAALLPEKPEIVTVPGRPFRLHRPLPGRAEGEVSGSLRRRRRHRPYRHPR